MKSNMLARFFTPRDPIEQQLADLAKQGSGMARIAHAAATLLIVLFSLGSLVALSGDALSGVVTQWRSGAGVNIPAAISVAVSTLLVFCMDVGMIAAASELRVLNVRRADSTEKRLHQTIIVLVGLLEAATYFLMSSNYEHPAAAATWLLIGARAASAPVLSVYLAMRRTLPISARDILAQAELAAGVGVLRDVSLAASDQNAPLDRKMRLYSAAAIMTPADRTRLTDMISAVGTNTLPPLLEAPDSAYTALLEGPGLPDNDRPPTGPGSPQAAPGASPVRTPERKTQEPIPIRRAPERQTRKTAARSKQNAEARVRSVWHPGITITEIERRAHVSRSTGHKWNRVLIGETTAQAAQ